MNLQLNSNLATAYKSKAQQVRVMTEAWLSQHMFCPRCGNAQLSSFENNKPVADVYCEECYNQYELKSKEKSFSTKIPDGAYDTMIARISSNENPDLFCLSYTPQFQVSNLILVPKHFFVPNIIEQRKPLPLTAKRAGWIGCNILINQVPEQGKIVIIHNGIIQNKSSIITKTQKSSTLFIDNLSARGWLIDTLVCINRIKTIEFKLSDMYCFEQELSIKHPNNKYIKAKIRQQLQLLRNKGYIKFLGRGIYRKII